jgi:ring-1,2-phenylacetyl-CoA epoxidase subunit PaaD
VVEPAVKRDEVLQWLAEVPDPEIPVVSIMELGIVRDVQCGAGVVVSLSPTYSGCPATEAIEANVIAALEDRGVADVRIKRVLSPPWTTDWISDAGRELHGQRCVPCPRCESEDTEVVSEFGSTACKASYRCKDCLEPFEYFKCI